MIEREVKHEFRRYSLADRFISQVDQTLSNIFGRHIELRSSPAEEISGDAPLSTEEARLSASLMRVNHAGEMAAQALYQGQSLTARDPLLRAKLEQASIEENDHLSWCRQRLEELGAQPSRLDPAWYIGSLAMGITAGILGDRWNLGFLAETERQVVKHLEGHLKRLPDRDEKSRNILDRMREDEAGHARLADDLGAAPLPAPVRSAMRFSARIMTTTAERL